MVWNLSVYISVWRYKGFWKLHKQIKDGWNWNRFHARSSQLYLLDTWHLTPFVFTQNNVIANEQCKEKPKLNKKFIFFEIIIILIHYNERPDAIKITWTWVNNNTHNVGQELKVKINNYSFLFSELESLSLGVLF